MTIYLKLRQLQQPIWKKTTEWEHHVLGIHLSSWAFMAQYYSFCFSSVEVGTATTFNLRYILVRSLLCNLD